MPQQVCRHVVLDGGGLLLRVPLGGPLLQAIAATALGDGVPRVRSAASPAVLVEAAEDPDQVVTDRDWAVLHVEVTSGTWHCSPSQVCRPQGA